MDVTDLVTQAGNSPILGGFVDGSGNVGVDGPSDADGNVTGGLMQAEESQGFPGQHNLPQVCVYAAINTDLFINLAFARSASYADQIFVFPTAGRHRRYDHGRDTTLQGQFATSRRWR